MGTAEPPHGMTRSAERSRPFSSGSTPIQMVGTPAATVTRSVLDEVGDRRRREVGPGITRLAPARHAAWARPHALAWNIGTTGRITVALAHSEAVGA